MTRLTLALAACISLASTASASLTPPRQRSLFGPEVSRAQALKLSGEAVGSRTASEFKVTERTEVLLDGKACRYADVPEQATILRMEVTPDGKIVLRLYFRSGK